MLSNIRTSCRNIILSLAVMLPVMSSFTACDGMNMKYRTIEGGVWNTTYNIIYNSDRDLRDSVVDVMRRVELSLSPFCDSSLVSRVNRGESVTADSLLRRIFLASQEVNRKSGGAFDPTVAPLINLWGFGYRSGASEPTQAMIDSVMPSVGISECFIDSLGHIVRKSPATEFNFSAITKGYGCDLVGEMLRRNGCSDYLVEIGGEIAMSGRNPRGDSWRIMVDAPVDCDSAVVHKRMAVMQPAEGGVATSGNYRNYKESSSGRIWHTISTADGRPAHTDLLSVTVVAPSAMYADAYATACMAMGSDSARAMIDRVEGVEALFVTVGPADSAFVISATPGFPEIER